MNSRSLVARAAGTPKSEWTPQEAEGPTQVFRNFLTGQLAKIDSGKVAISTAEGAEPQWDDVFADPDSVGQSEYAALLEHVANVADIDNIGGEVASDRRISADARDAMVGSLDEVISWARTMQRDLKRLRYTARTQTAR